PTPSPHLLSRHPITLLLLRRVFRMSPRLSLLFFFFNDPATTEIYTLSLHDALPIFGSFDKSQTRAEQLPRAEKMRKYLAQRAHRSEEHTSELQSLTNLVCRLLLEKKKKKLKRDNTTTHTANNRHTSARSIIITCSHY